MPWYGQLIVGLITVIIWGLIEGKYQKITNEKEKYIKNRIS